MPSYSSPWFGALILWAVRCLFGLISELSLVLFLVLATVSSFLVMDFLQNGISPPPSEMVSLWEHQTR